MSVFKSIYLRRIFSAAKLVDFFIIIPALGFVIFSFFFAYMRSGGNPVINIKTAENEWVFPVNAEETLTVSGPLGNTVIEIQNNTAFVFSSPCLNQICVTTGVIRQPGQWAACLPNRIMVYIEEGRNGNEVDAAAW